MRPCGHTGDPQAWSLCPVCSDAAKAEVHQCIQTMERQIIDDSLKRRLVPLDVLPPEVQEAVIREMFNRK